MPTVAELLNQALRHHQVGQPGLAENLYRQVLLADPRNADAWHLLGLLASQQGNRQEAVQHWQRAVQIQPQHAGALFSLGATFLETGDLAQAQSAFERSLAIDPSNMKAEYDLSLVLTKLGKSDEAKEHLDRYRKMQEAEHAASGAMQTVKN